MAGEGKVYVSGHAIRQFVTRYPEDIPSGAYRPVGARVVAVIFREVTHAIEAGRRSASEPSWMGSEARRKTKASANRKRGTIRYVWTEDRRRAYLIVKGRTQDGGPSKWTVVTTFRVRSEARLVVGSENAP